MRRTNEEGGFLTKLSNIEGAEMENKDAKSVSYCLENNGQGKDSYCLENNGSGKDSPIKHL